MEEINLDSSIQTETAPISNTSKSYLLECTRWSLFFVVLGFIFIGLMVIGAFALVAVGASGSSYQSEQFFLIGVVYLVLAILFIFPILYLLKFSSKMKAGLNQSNNKEIEVGFGALKSLFRFMGIMTIVIISIYILIILAAVVVGISSI